MRHATFILALALAAWPPLGTAATPDPLAREHAFYRVTHRVYAKARLLLSWGDFAGLERLYTQAADPRLLNGDTLSMTDQQDSVGDAIDAWWPANPNDDRSFETQLTLMREWTQQRPTLALAHIAYARTLSAYAWSIRGTSYAREIPSESRAKFASLSATALAYLRSHRELIESDRYGRIRMLWAMRDAGTDLDEVWTTAQRYMRQDPTHYALYAFLGEALAPRWGGSAEALEFAARESVKATRDQIGFAAYARLYTSVGDLEYGAAIFTDSLAKWPDMKQGFEDALARRPTLWVHHRLAYFACLAKDRATLQQQLDMLGDELKQKPEWWGKNGARTQAECVRFANQT